MHIDNIHLIHDDLILATRTMSEHIVAIGEIKEAMSNAALTLNLTKCKFGYNEIKFWGMVFSAVGMRPDPDKIDALNFSTARTNKDDLISFLCMMQSNSDFIPNFAQKAAPLRELTYHNIHFKWKPIHQKCFESLIQDFKKDTLLRYYDTRKKDFVITDANITGLGQYSLKEIILVQQDQSLLPQEQPRKQRVDIHNLIWKQLQQTLHFVYFETT